MAHESFKTLATKLISKNGQLAQLVKISNSGDAWNPTQSETTADVIALNIQIDLKEVDNNLVEQNDLMFLIDSSVEPDIADRFRYESEDYEIKWIGKLKPAGTAIMYKLLVKT